MREKEGGGGEVQGLRFQVQGGGQSENIVVNYGGVQNVAIPDFRRGLRGLHGFIFQIYTRKSIIYPRNPRNPRLILFLTHLHVNRLYITVPFKGASQKKEGAIINFSDVDDADNADLF